VKRVRLIKMCLSETYSKVIIVTAVSGSFTTQNVLKEKDAL